MKPLPRIIPHSDAEKKLLLISGAAAAVLLLIDQLTKVYFAGWQLHESKDLIPGILSFTYVRNLGAAWSLFSGYGLALTAFGLCVVLGIVMFFRKFAENCPERYVALALVVSGIIGNSIDRLFRGAVIDFIHVHYNNVWHYPVFNVADMAICCGIGVFVISGFLRKDLSKENADSNR